MNNKALLTRIELVVVDLLRRTEEIQRQISKVSIMRISPIDSTEFLSSEDLQTLEAGFA